MRHGLAGFVALMAAAGCQQQDPCGEPLYAGKATDEAWMAFVDAEQRVVVDDGKALKLTSPQEGQSLSASAPTPTFTWTTPLSARRGAPPNGKKGWWRSLTGLLVSEAWAHGAPVTGATHLLELAVPGRQCPVRVIATGQSWTPDEQAWAVLRTAEGGTISFTATSAYLRENRISEGPFRASKPREISVEK